MTVFTLGLNSCLSKPVKIQTVIYTPTIYFPKFPPPKEGVVIPLDYNNNRVTDYDTEIAYIIMPYWYWNLIIDYKANVDIAEAKYKSVENTNP